MRIILHGVGAIGGVIGAALTEAGTEVVGIARGARLEAIRSRGLTFRAHDGARVVPLPCVGDPSEIDWRPDDMILLCVKSQHTAAALASLRAAGVDDQPIFCAQNGVANEALALRFFPNVHAVNVMMPAEYVALDEAVVFSKPCYGVFDVGRYPGGSDSGDAALARAMTAAKMDMTVTPRAMAFKYGKLIHNLANIVGAALGPGIDDGAIAEALKAEGRAVLEAAGIAWRDVGAGDPRRGTLFKMVALDGYDRVGSSTSQSLARGAGSIETDYLNGEIVLLGRLHGLETPANAFAAALGARLARNGARPGAVSRAELAAGVGLPT